MSLDMDQNILTKDHVQRLRITTQGKIKRWVAFSLQFLLDEDSDCKRVVLDTLPVDISTSATDSTPKNDVPDRLHPSTNMVYRLISVVEIIKREYLKSLETTHSTRLLGLHQYNETGTLEDLGITVKSSNETPTAADERLNELESAEVRRSRNIIQTISGKQFTRRKETPFMRITLSTNELPELIEKGATYQPPSSRKLSKSAKSRARKRAKALQPGQGTDRMVLEPPENIH